MGNIDDRYNSIDRLYNNGDDWSESICRNMVEARQNRDRTATPNNNIGTHFAPLWRTRNGQSLTKRQKQIMTIFLLWHRIRHLWLIICLLLAIFAFSLYINMPNKAGKEITITNGK